MPISCAAACWRTADSAVAAIFVTATGTDIGKTFVTAGLIRHLRAAKEPVGALKPVVSGYGPSVVETSDPAVLLRAMDLPVSADYVERVSPWRFRAPLSPDMAAAREGRAIDFDELVDFSRRATADNPGTLFIEGVGGIMVPLDDTHTVLDWMTSLRAPILLVTGSYLGSISHTLTALHVLIRRNLKVAAVVVSESVASPVPLEETVTTFARFSDKIGVVGLPRLPEGIFTHPAFGEIAALL